MFYYYLVLSLRSFKRTPMVSFLMVIAIAVGIGITMTSLSVYHMMSLDPIPEKSHQLFHPQIQTMDEGRNWWTNDNMPLQLTYQDTMNLMAAAIPERKSVSMRSASSVHLNDSVTKPFIEDTRFVGRDFFAMFKLEFIHGGEWSANDEAAGARVIVIDEYISKRLFGTNNAVGNSVYLDDAAYRVVGVIKSWDIHVKYYDLNNGAFNEPERIFAPFSLVSVNEIQSWGNSSSWKRERVLTFADKLKSEIFWLQFWVELPDEKTKNEYGEFLMAYMQEQQKLGRFNRKDLQYKLNDVNEWIKYNQVISSDNKIMVALSFMFLAVCLVNILGLLLAKFLRRAPEIGVRRALGASRVQVFYQHIVEVSVLGLIGSVFGVVIAQACLWGVRTTHSYYTQLAYMDISMLFAAPFIAVVASIFAGLYPAWLVCRTNPAIYLKSQ